MTPRHLAFLAIYVAACGSSTDQGDGGIPTADAGDSAAQGDVATQNDSGTKIDASSGNDSGSVTTKVVFVIPMENRPQSAIYGNTADAPYINGTLMTAYAHTTMFTDELPALDSEPHYIWMESGTNVFSDHTFSSDADSSSSNSTSSTAHLAAQLNAAHVTWTSYQEGITAGTCPTSSISSAFYAAKHNPFVFFQDIAATCISHHKPLTMLASDLAGSSVSTYNFITPNLCNDMHGDPSCSHADTDAANIKAGDDWLKANLQPIIDYALAHDGYVFITWDEGDSTNLIPFIAIGKHSIAGHAGTVKYTHSSLLKSEEEILGVSALPSVTSAADFTDLFVQGTFP